MRRLVLLAAAAVLLVVAPAAQADTLTVDFESGPPLGAAVNDDYAASAYVRFLQFDEGFRPYRRSAPGQARSGSVVADVGVDVCERDAGPGVDCELPLGGTSGRLLRTASSVTLYAGLFTAAPSPVNVRLVGYRANGTVAATGAPVTITNTTTFTAQVRVASAAADIASFELVVAGDGARGAAIGFDDLTLEYPANSLPELSVSAPAGPVAVLQGKTTNVPVQLTRLNGSNGPAHMSVTGLPAGVTAQVVPSPIPGTQGAATVRLTATANAPRFEVPRTFTIRADPQGNANVAPGVRTTTVLMRVGGNFDLVGPNAAAEVPTCAATDVPFRIVRDRAFTGTVALEALNLPSGMAAEFLPGPAIPPGGGFTVDATLRLIGGPAVVVPAEIEIRATSPGAPARTFKVAVAPATPNATLESTVGLTPRHLAPGTELRVRGNGFCPGTIVRAGNELAEAPATIAPDGRSLTFRVPRLATTGPLTIVPPPGSGPYASTNVLTVRSFRNQMGFRFINYGFGALSIDELTDLVGADDLFIKVNPCWPWGSCDVVTGFLDPGAAIVWGVLNISLKAGGGGHCLGMVRAVQELMAGRVKRNRFASVNSIWDIPANSGPGTETLKSYLDARQALQGTAEYMGAFVFRDRRIKSQVDFIESELRAGRDPGVTLLDGHLAGHQLLAYDMEQRADGGLDILAYNPNRPFDASENGSGLAHRTAEVQSNSVIHVSPDRRSWTYEHSGLDTWSGSGDDGSMIAMPLDFVPKELSLPGLGEISLFLNMVILGSVDGSVRTDGGSDGAEFMPLTDSGAAPGSAGAVIGRRGAKTVSHTVTGVKKGAYSQAVTGRGFVAAASDVPTAKGVRDRVGGVPAARQVRFEALAGAPARPLELQLATQAGEAGRSASIRTRTFARGAETASLRSGALRYTHDGAPTRFSFTLGSVRRQGGPATFESGPLRIGRGDRVTAKPESWSRLGRVRLMVRHRGGGASRRVLRNRAATRARVTLRAPRLRGRKAIVTARFGRLPREAAGGLVLQVRDGARTVARRSIAVRRPRAGARAFRWRLPKLAGGRYRLVARLAVSVGGRHAGTVRRSRAAPFVVRR